MPFTTFTSIEDKNQGQTLDAGLLIINLIQAIFGKLYVVTNVSVY
jgi:hypothetical protein